MFAKASRSFGVSGVRMWGNFPHTTQNERMYTADLGHCDEPAVALVTVPECLRIDPSCGVGVPRNFEILAQLQVPQSASRTK